MDAEIENGEDFVSIDGFPLPAERRNHSFIDRSQSMQHSHIIYKRSDSSDTQMNDYGNGLFYDGF